MRRLLARLGYLIARNRRDRELREEIEAHRQMVQDRLEAEGVAHADAASASRRAMGNVTLARESAREVWILPSLESIWQDVVYAFRTFRRQPGFTWAAAAALAAAIGLNTSLFTIYNALVLREWPVRKPHEVVAVFNMSPRDLRARPAGAPWGLSLDEVRYFSTHSRTVTGLVVTGAGGGDKTIGDDDAAASWVSGNYFSLLGVEMAHGRGFLPDEDRVASPAAVAVLSHSYWQRRFGGDASIVGSRVSLEDVPFTVVGVTARSFTGTLTEPVDLWMPLGSSALLRPDDRYVKSVVLNPANCCSAVAARLAPGVTREEAEAELTLLDRQYRNPPEQGGGIRLTGTQLTANPKNDATGAFTPIFAGSMLVLLIACANVANLLMARASVRRREIGIRLSIGAGRRRIVRQLLTESVVLAGGAAIAGLAIAMGLPGALIRLAGARPGALQLTPDNRVLWFTASVAIASALVFGLLPAFHGVRAGAMAAMKDLPLRPGRMPIRGVLLSIQVTIAVVLLICSAVIANAVRRIGDKDLGFSRDDISVLSMEVPARGFDAARTRAVSLQIAEALSGRPGVVLTSTAPLGSGTIKGAFRLPGEKEEHFNSVYEVAPGFFSFLRIPVIAGRAIDDRDSDRPVIVINESFAIRFWRSAAAAVGRHIVAEPGSGGFNRTGDLEIIGVVRDAHNASLTSVDNTIYQPLSGRGLPQVLLAESSGSREAAVAAIKAIDPALRVKAAPWAANISSHVRGSLTAAMLAGAMGGLALAFAAIGMFAVFACWVQQRTHEIGIRMALGARSIQVVSLLLRSSAVSIGLGAAIGVAGAAVASRLLRGYMFGLSPADPLAYGAVLAIVAAAGAIATWWPARRATRVEPVQVLRCE
jgi:predicted permease